MPCSEKERVVLQLLNKYIQHMHAILARVLVCLPASRLGSPGVVLCM
jgi:hypothetical protein